VTVFTLFAPSAEAQVDVGASYDCLLGDCDANTSDEGGDHHNVDLAQHLAEARAQGNGALHRTAFAEVGLRFRPCFSGPTGLVMSDIHIVGDLRGFGDGPVIRADVQVQTIVRDVTDDLQLANDIVYEREEDGDIGTTVIFNVDEVEDSSLTVNLVEGHTYDFVVRVRARKWGALARSNFQTGDHGVTFERVQIFPNLPDADGDGLFDQWEIAGLDEDCDGAVEVDLPAMGADPTVKDLFLELDWMTGQQPTQAAVAAVVEAFSLAPPNAGGVNTPGEGIRLWVDTGDLTDPAAAEDGKARGTCGDGVDNGGGDGIDALDTDCLVGALVFSSLPGGGNLGGGNGFPVGGIPNVNVDTDGDGESDFVEAKFDPARGNFDPARLRVFRYGINSVAAGPAPTMGGQANSNNFLLFNQNAGLLMHEFGHTLGLSHGGPVDTTNCKPNYVSVMNYRFTGGIMVAGGLGNGQDIDGDGTGDGFILDYSPPRFPSGRGFAPLAPVNETAWTEANQFDVSDPANFTAWTTGGAAASEDGAGTNTCGDGIDNGGGDGADQADPDCQPILVPSRINAAPDWNNDGDTNDQAPPPIDFNTAFWNPAANESVPAANSCRNTSDDDGDALVDFADPDCIGNTRCALPANAGVTLHNGADDWTGLVLDPKVNARADAGELPVWDDEPTEEEIGFVLQAMQTTDLAVSQKLADPDPVVAGQELRYSMTVENLGPRPAVEVVLVDTLPAELHFLDGDPACSETGGNTVECALGGLGVGESREVAIRTRVSVDTACAPGEQFASLGNSAEAVNRQGLETDPANNITRVESRVLCARYEYAAKFVCGIQSDAEDPRLAEGRYRTTTNIHNPNDEETHFFKKLAFTFPPKEQRPGALVPIRIHRLAYDAALKVDCGEIRRLHQTNTPYVEGYLVVQSPLPLDVDAVYTVDSPVQGEIRYTSIDVEPVDERERKPGPRPDLIVEPAHPEPPFDERFGVQLPEGVPNSLFCGDNGPSGGPARTVDAIVRNIGLGDAGPSTLRIDFLNAGPEDVVIGALAAGTSTVVSVDIPRGCYRAGACSFKLNADAGTTVIEADETNNSAQSLCLSPAG
jgi:uncharacterized repeat protein (TIGR01451 family)